MTDNRPEQTAELREGDTVGSYKITSMLGVGGMGRVYHAVGPNGEEVALKLIKGDIARDSVFRKRFDREARIAQSVQHQNLVPVLDTGEHAGIPYLTQSFIRGGSLADRIEKQGPLDVPSAVKMAREVAGALDALHANGLVHRDIKPGNILLDEQGTA